MGAVLLAELRHNGRRAVASALSIAICVAFVAVVLAATATMKGFLADTVGGRAVGADVVVSRTEGDPASLDPAAAARLQALAQAGAVSLQRTGYAVVGWPDVSTVSELVALPQEASQRWFDVTAGRLPASPTEVLVDAGTAQTAGTHVGDRLVLGGTRTGTGAEAQAATPVTVVGLAHVRGPSIGSGRQVFAAYDVVAAVSAGVVYDAAVPGDSMGPDDVMLAAAPDVPVESLLAAARAAAPQASVRTSAAWVDVQAAALTKDVDVIGRIVLAFTGVALVVAIIVIANTFTILLAQRTERLALLRCIGATRRQLRRAVLGEALALGVLASAAGLAVGVGLVEGAAAVLAARVDAAAGLHAVLPWTVLVVPGLAGILLTLGASWLPAARATRVAPLAALRPATVARARTAGIIRTVLGAALLALGGLLVTGAAAGSQSLGTAVGVLVGVVGGTACALGVVVLGPVLVPLVARLLGRPLRASGPVGDLAVANTLRSPARAAATSIALFVGVGLITVLSVGAATTQAAALAAIDAHLPVDVVIDTTGLGAGEARGLASQLAALDGTAAVAPIDQVDVTVTGQGRPVPTGADATTETVYGGDPAALAAVLRDGTAPAPGTALVSAGQVQNLGLTAGQGLTFTSASGTSVTTAVRPSALDQTLLSTQDLARLGGSAVPAQLLLRADEDVDARAYLDDVGQIVDRVGGGQLWMYGPLSDRAATIQILSVMLAIATGLLAVAVLISLVGVGNTLSLAVLERTQESGLQRALGMTRRQLRRMLAAEALLLAGTGVALGLVVGTVLGWAGARVLLSGVADVGGPHVPWLRLGVVVAVALGAALLASVLPGRRAARVSPTQALAATG